jgi:hypothetical protein
MEQDGLRGSLLPDTRKTAEDDDDEDEKDFRDEAKQARRSSLEAVCRDGAAKNVRDKKRWGQAKNVGDRSDVIGNTSIFDLSPWGPFDLSPWGPMSP